MLQWPSGGPLAERLSDRWSEGSRRCNDSGIYVISGVLALLLVTVTVVAVCLRVEHGVSTETAFMQGIEHTPAVKLESCSSPSCGEVSKRLLLSLSHEMAPCANFYEYVCEGWRQRHPLREDKYQVRMTATFICEGNGVARILFLGWRRRGGGATI